MFRGWECPRELESLLPLHQTNEPLSDAVPRFSSTAGGKEKAKLKFRRNGIPESWDKQDLLIHALPSLQKIIFCFSFAVQISPSFTRAVLAECCRIPGQAVPVCATKFHFGVRARAVPWPVTGGFSFLGCWSSPVQLLTELPQLNELQADKKNSFCAPELSISY